MLTFDNGLVLAEDFLTVPTSPIEYVPVLVDRPYLSPFCLASCQSRFHAKLQLVVPTRITRQEVSDSRCHR